MRIVPAFDLLISRLFSHERRLTSGRMVAIRDGKYDHAPLPDPALGPRKVDVATQYNAERFRPQYASRLGDPMLLSAHLGAPVIAG